MTVVAQSTIYNRIQDLIGTYTDLNAYRDHIYNGFNYIADLIPTDSILWTTREVKHDETTGYGEIGGASDLNGGDYHSTKKVLRVTRNDQREIAVSRNCQEISFAEKESAEDAESIHYNVRSYKSPAYSIRPNGVLEVTPAINNTDFNTIYYFEYFNEAQHSGLGDKYSAREYGFPQEAVHASCIRSAMNILLAKISDAVQDDEDAELLQLLQAQRVTLAESLQEELLRLNVPANTIGVTEKNKERE